MEKKWEEVPPGDCAAVRDRTVARLRLLLALFQAPPLSYKGRKGLKNLAALVLKLSVLNLSSLFGVKAIRAVERYGP